MKKRGIALKKEDHLYYDGNYDGNDGNDDGDDGNDVVDDKFNFLGILTASQQSEASTLQNYVVEIKMVKISP